MATMSIWKAPRSVQVAKSCQTVGFVLDDFDDPSCLGLKEYGFLFFARDRELAERFARYYKAGIIEIVITVDDYERLPKIERRFAPGEFFEILVAYSDIGLLNSMSVERKWHLC